MVKCQLWATYEAYALFWIKDIQPFMDKPTKMWLCTFCAEGLRSNDVHIQRVTPTYPAI